MATLRGRRRMGAAVVGAVLTAAAAATAAGSSAGAEPAGTEATYVVLFRQGASSRGAAAAVQAAGGTLVADYNAIGVVIARSSNAGFEARIEAARRGRGSRGHQRLRGVRR